MVLTALSEVRVSFGRPKYTDHELAVTESASDRCNMLGSNELGFD